MIVASNPHIIEVEGGGWSVTGRPKLDGATVKVWKQWILLPKEVESEVEGTKASLRRKSVFASTFDLYVGGRQC